MQILPDAHTASICSCVSLEWRSCRGWWKDWNGQSADWSCCPRCHTDLLRTVGNLMVSTEVGPQTVATTGLSMVHLILSPSPSSYEIFLSTFFNFPAPSFICDHDINQMQALPEKEKGKKFTKVTSVLPVKSIIHVPNIITLSF